MVNKIVPCVTAKSEKVNKFKMTIHDKCCEGNERALKETEGKIGNLLVIGPILPPRFRCRTQEEWVAPRGQQGKYNVLNGAKRSLSNCRHSFQT